MRKRKLEFDSRRRLLAWWAETWRPRSDLDRVTWCEKNVRIPAEVSPRPGKCDLSHGNAYMREPLLAFDAPEVEIIVLAWATQLGKTTVLIFALASQAALAPTPCMFVAPDKDALVELRDKFYLFGEECKDLAGELPSERHRNNRWIDAGRLRCHLAYPMNTQRLSGKACQIVFASEVDRYRSRREQGSPEKLAAERVKAFFNFKVAYESSVTDEQSRIWALYKTSDQRRYHVPCPICNHFQELRLFPHKDGPFAGAGGIVGLKDANGNWRTPEQARAEAYYLCERGCKITDDKKPLMIPDGIWVPKGQQVEDGKLIGEPERGPRIWGGQLSSLYAEPITFGRFAAEYLDSRSAPEKLQSFWQNWVSLPYKRKLDAPKWRDVGRRLRGAHRRGTVPAGALFLTAGVDVGADYTKWVVRAWTEGSTSWLVDWGSTHARVGEDGSISRSSHLDQLDDAVLNRDWLIGAQQQNPLGETRLRVRLLGIDCRYDTRNVHAWSRKHKGRVYTLAGVDDLKSGDFYRVRTIERDMRTKKPYPGGLERWEISRALYNADVQGRWKQPLDEPGSWWLTDASLEESETYLRELVNEAPVRVKQKRGRSITVWEKVEAGTGNHSWDAEVYARALADMVTGGDWDGLVERARRERGRDGAKERRSDDLAAREQPDDFSAR